MGLGVAGFVWVGLLWFVWCRLLFGALAWGGFGCYWLLLLVCLVCMLIVLRGLVYMVLFLFDLVVWVVY